MRVIRDKACPVYSHAGALQMGAARLSSSEQELVLRRERNISVGNGNRTGHGKMC